VVALLAMVGCAPSRLQLMAAANTEHAYTVVGDSLVVAMSARGRSHDEAVRALDAVAQSSASRERCAPAGRVAVRGESDPRLGEDIVKWLATPRLVGVLSCVRP
jgi:hypothetical protein